jgi:hypothetical protein
VSWEVLGSAAVSLGGCGVSRGYEDLRPKVRVPTRPGLAYSRGRAGGVGSPLLSAGRALPVLASLTTVHQSYKLAAS